MPRKGYKQSKEHIAKRMEARTRAEPEAIKKDWESIWLHAKEMNLLQGGDKVTEPYRQHPVVYAATNKIATNVARVPFILITDTGQRIYDDPILDLFRNPNPYMSMNEMWQKMIIFLKLDGECFWVLEKSQGQAIGRGGLPGRIWVPNPAHVKEKINKKTGMVTEWVVGKRTYSTDEVIHFALPNPYHPIRGMGALEPLSVEIEADYRASVFNNKFFDNDASIGGILMAKDDLQEEDYKKLAMQLKARNTGVKNAHNLLILDNEMKYDRTSLSQAEMDFLEGREYIRDLICSAIGVPKFIMGFDKAPSKATAEESNRVFWDMTVIPLIDLIEAQIDRSFLKVYAPNYYSLFDLDKVEELHEHLKDKTETALELAKLGMPLNQINDKLDLGFELEGPEYEVGYMPINMIPLTAESAFQQTEPVKAVEPVAKDANTFNKRVKNNFLARQQALEVQLTKKLKLFFFKERKKVENALKLSEKAIDQDSIDEMEKIKALGADKFEQLVLPFVGEAIIQGSDLAVSLIGTGNVLDAESHIYTEILMNRKNRIRAVHGDVWNELADEIAAGLGEGESIQAITERVKGVYRTSEARAKVIARTETVSAMNTASNHIYEQEGIEKKEWIVTRDGNARDSHTRAANQGPIPMTAKFNNGLRFPGDPSGSAKEVVNCRCTLAPVLEV